MRCKMSLLGSLILVMAIVGCPSTSTARERRVTPETLVWRVTDTEGGAVYFAQSIQAHWHAPAGAFLTATGTVTFTPSQGPGGEIAHVGSADTWRVPFSVSGTESTYKYTVSGLAAITAGGAEKPAPPAGQGYEFVTFRDIQSKKQITIKQFSADKVKAGDVPGLLPKKK